MSMKSKRVGSTNETETPEATIKRLSRQLEETESALKKTTNWWRSAERRADAAQTEVAKLRGIAAGIAAIAAAMQPRQPDMHPDDIPF